MADKKDNKKKKANIFDKETVNTIGNLTKNTSDLESRIYGTSPMVKNEIDFTFGTMYKSIELLTTGDGDNQKTVNHQRLIDDSLEDPETNNVAQSLESKLNGHGGDNMQVLSTIAMQNTPRAALYKDFDLICKFFPELERAIEVMRDSILSPDNISKETFSITFKGSSDTDEIKHRVNQIKRDYKLDKKISSTVYEVLKYGECNVFLNTYSSEMKKMMAGKQANMNSLTEGVYVTEDGRRIESAVGKEIILENGFYKVKKTDTRLSESISATDSESIASKIFLESLDKIVTVYEYDQDFLGTATEIKSIMESQTMLLSEVDSLSPDIDPTTKLYTSNPFSDLRERKLKAKRGSKKVKGKEELNIPGCVMKTLDTLKLYLLHAGDILIGAWYIETDNSLNGDVYSNMMDTMGGNTSSPNDAGRGIATSNGNSGGMTLDSTVMNQTLVNKADRNKMNNDFVMLSLAKLAVNKLDRKYLETNPDMVQFIYNFCKMNDVVNNKMGVKLTFIPPEQLVSFKINEDKYNRGISKLAKALFPAKLYVIMLVSNFLTNTIRKNDMKAYYIKSGGLNKNVTQTVMNAAYQLKKTQFNIHDIMDINRTFNVIGKNHEIFIPVSENGDKPIDFDIISGDQGTGMENEFLDFLKKSSLNALGVPPNLVDSLMDIDAVKPFVMANERFARSSIADQIELEEPLNDLLNTLADFEIENFNYGDMHCHFPTPSTINNNNKTERLNNNQAMVDAMLKTYLGDAFMNAPEGPKIYDLMYNKIMQKIMPEIYSEYDLEKIFKECKVAVTKAKSEPVTGEGDPDAEMNEIINDED
ncbi:MAG: hypothetical protein ACRC0G_07095 [Fusobacteriaceae bacterium]